MCLHVHRENTQKRTAAQLKSSYSLLVLLFKLLVSIHCSDTIIIKAFSPL